LRRLTLLLLMLAALPAWPYPVTCSRSSASIARDSYLVSVVFNDVNLEVSGYVLVNHVNRLNRAFDELYFHVYPNAFAAKGGGIDIGRVEVNGSPAPFEITGPDKTLLHISLPRPLKPQAAAAINITFTVHVPNTPDRFGYYRGILCLGNWYPVLAVYDVDKGWHLDPYYPHGESFHFYFSDYELFFAAPPGYIVAATGILVGWEMRNGFNVTHWRSICVREIAVAASKNYVVSSTRIGNVTIYSYYLPQHKNLGEYALKVAGNSIRVFSEHYGPYPYPEYRVCESYGWFGGMEYPMLVLISERLYRIRRKWSLEIVVAHETAHQWWYVTVGDDEANEPWMDEAFAEYSQVLYVEWIYGAEKAEEVFNSWIRRPYYAYLDRGREDRAVALSVWDYRDASQYYATVYNKGAYVLRLLRYMMGDQKFFELLRRLYQEYRFRFVRIADFARLAEKVYGRDLDWFFNYWVYSAGTASYAVDRFTYKETAFGCEVTVVVKQVSPRDRLVPVYMPVTIRGERTAKTFRLWVNGTGVLKTYFGERPVTVIVDDGDIVPGREKGSQSTAPVAAPESLYDLLPYLAVAATYGVASLLLLRLYRKPVEKREHQATKSSGRESD